MRIAVLGGGPGGLLAALLAKRGDPGREVTVFERNRAGDTFGFGVVFSDATLDGIDAADPVLRRALTEHGVHWDPIEVRLRGERWRFGGNGMAAVARRTLLTLLQQRAAEAGVDLRFSAPVRPDDLLGAGYDLVVAADGANSQLRARFAGAFGPSVVTATAKFIWFGTTYPFAGLTFVHEQGPHGVFAVHGYPIGNGVSTFIVETDERSWREAGLGRVRRQPAARAQRPGHPGLPGKALRDPDRRLPAAGEQLPVGQLPHLAHAALAAPGGTLQPDRRRPARRRRAHRALLRRLGHQDGHGGRHRAGAGPGRGRPGPDDGGRGAGGIRGRPAAAGDQDPGRGPALAVLVGALRPVLPEPAAVAVRLPLLQPLAARVEAAPARRGLRRVGAPGLACRARRSASDPLRTPIAVAGTTQPHRVLPVAGGQVRLASGPLPLLGRASGAGLAPWAARVSAPDTEAGLGQTQEAVARALAAGACLLAVGDGTALTRRLVCEAARLEHGAVTLLVEDGSEDTARTAVLSGRTDLIGRRP